MWRDRSQEKQDPARRSRRVLPDAKRWRVLTPVLLERGRDRVERTGEVRTDGRDGSDNDNGDEGCDQAVLDGRGAGLVAQKALCQTLHSNYLQVPRLWRSPTLGTVPDSSSAYFCVPVLKSKEIRRFEF